LEDKLLSEFKTMMENRLNSVIHSEGVGDYITENVLQREELNVVLQQHFKDFERLKHSIIYEKILEAELKILLVANKEISGNDEKIRKSSAAQAARFFNLQPNVYQ